MIHLKEVFLANGYPEPVTRRTLNHQRHSPPVPAETPEMEKKLLYLSYIKGVSEKIEHICAPLGVKTIFKSRHTLRQSLMRVKSPRQEDVKTGVVYEVPCAECNHVYIGETGRCLQKRIKEHKYAVKTHDTKNGLAVLAWKNDHRVNWDAAEVRAFEEHYTKRKVLEALMIRKQKHTSNLDCGLQLNPIWKPLLDQPLTHP